MSDQIIIFSDTADIPMRDGELIELHRKSTHKPQGEMIWTE
jgi:hypothetical protein